MGFDNLLMTKSRKLLTILTQPFGVCWIVLETSLQMGKSKNTRPGRCPGSLLTIFRCLIGWFLLTPQCSSSTSDSFK